MDAPFPAPTPEDQDLAEQLRKSLEAADRRTLPQHDWPQATREVALDEPGSSGDETLVDDMLKILLPLVVLIGIPVLGVLSVQAYFKRKRWGRPISPSQEVAPRPGLPRHRARRRSSRAALALAISLLVAVAGTGGYFAGRHRTESQRHDSRPAIMPADFQQLQVSRLAERKRLAATRGPSAQ